MSIHFRAEQPEFASQRARRRWAESITRLLREEDRRPDRFHPRGLAPIFDRRVVLASSGALWDVRDVLVDDTVDVRTRDLKALKTFLCEGAVSPLFRHDRDAARRSGAELRDRFSLSPAAAWPQAGASGVRGRRIQTAPRAGARG
jgi:hypothetical protein